MTVPPTVYVAGGGEGGGPESPPPHAVSAASTVTAEPHRAMLRIRDFILIPSWHSCVIFCTRVFDVRKHIACMNVSRRFRPGCRKILGREWLDSAGVPDCR